jgi:hypothetical protein
MRATLGIYICSTSAAPCLVKVQKRTRHGAPFFVPAPEFYNSFSFMRAGPAGAHRKISFALQNASFFAVIAPGDHTKTTSPSQVS